MKAIIKHRIKYSLGIGAIVLFGVLFYTLLNSGKFLIDSSENTLFIFYFAVSIIVLFAFALELIKSEKKLKEEKISLLKANIKRCENSIKYYNEEIEKLK